MADTEQCCSPTLILMIVNASGIWSRLCDKHKPFVCSSSQKSGLCLIKVRFASWQPFESDTANKRLEVPAQGTLWMSFSCRSDIVELLMEEVLGTCSLTEEAGSNLGDDGPNVVGCNIVPLEQLSAAAYDCVVSRQGAEKQ